MELSALLEQFIRRYDVELGGKLQWWTGLLGPWVCRSSDDGVRAGGHALHFERAVQETAALGALRCGGTTGRAVTRPAW